MQGHKSNNFFKTLKLQTSWKFRKKTCLICTYFFARTTVPAFARYLVQKQKLILANLRSKYYNIVKAQIFFSMREF